MMCARKSYGINYSPSAEVADAEKTRPAGAMVCDSLRREPCLLYAAPHAAEE